MCVKYIVVCVLYHRSVTSGFTLGVILVFCVELTSYVDAGVDVNEWNFDMWIFLVIGVTLFTWIGWCG